MSVVTYEGIVEQGSIRLTPEARLPEKAKVFVVVPDSPSDALPQLAHIYSPRLVNREDAQAFIMEVIEEDTDAAV